MSLRRVPVGVTSRQCQILRSLHTTITSSTTPFIQARRLHLIISSLSDKTQSGHEILVVSLGSYILAFWPYVQKIERENLKTSKNSRTDHNVHEAPKLPNNIFSYFMYYFTFSNHTYLCNRIKKKRATAKYFVGSTHQKQVLDSALVMILKCEKYLI